MILCSIGFLSLRRPLTVDSCVDYHCVNELPTYEVAVAVNSLDSEPDSTCLVPPGCCYTASDCSDGLRGTIDTCAKPLGSGPDVKGTCQHL